MAEGPGNNGVSGPEVAFGEHSDSASTGLPSTCTVVEKNSHREVYIVGTAHFSKQSQDDVTLVRTEYIS